MSRLVPILLIFSACVPVSGALFVNELNPSWMIGTSAALLLSALVWHAMLRQLGRGDVLALCLPVILGYNLLSIAIAQPDSASVQISLTLLGGCAFVVGVLLGGRGPGRIPPSIRLSELTFRPSPHLALASLFTLGLSASILTFSTNGVPALATNAGEARLDALANGYLGTIIVTSLQATMIYSGCALLTLGPRYGLRLRSIGYSTIFAGSALTLFAFANRGLYFVPVLVILAYVLARFNLHAVQAACAGVTAVLLVSYMGYRRDIGLYGEGYRASLVADGVPERIVFLGPVLNYFRGSSETLHRILTAFPDSVDYAYGRALFSPLFAPLPGEQASAGQFLKESLSLDFVGFGLAPGSIGGFYLDFGVVGVTVGFFLLGLLGRRLEERARCSTDWVLPYAFFVAHMWFMNFAHPFPYLAVLSTPIALLLLSRVSRRSPLPRSHNGAVLPA